MPAHIVHAEDGDDPDPALRFVRSPPRLVVRHVLLVAWLDEGLAPVVAVRGCS